MTKADGFEMLKGHVELDEAYVGGYRRGKPGRGAAGKTILMGLKERGGRMVAEVIPDIKTATRAKSCSAMSSLIAGYRLMNSIRMVYWRVPDSIMAPSRMARRNMPGARTM